MEAPEEVSLGPKDQFHILKGKRTKRVRPQSPIPSFSLPRNGDHHDQNNKLSATATSSAEFEENHSVNADNNNSSRSSSTEEEEDMANCLILLAQGLSRESPKEEDGNGSTMMMMMMMKQNNSYCNNNNNNNSSSSSSRKFMEAATMGANKAGFYVYECKTCSRTFPSFQALGGHRASHKKPKALASSMAAIVDQEEKKKKKKKKKKKEEEFILCNNNNHIINNSNNPLSCLQILNHSSSTSNKNKVHECSICGAEFTSGQALGGHMRRHRSSPIGTTTNTTSLGLSNYPVALQADRHLLHHPTKKRNVISLDLDLNLPAPEDDYTESSSSKFAFESNQQQQQQQQETSLVFSSTPALVDCHY